MKVEAFIASLSFPTTDIASRSLNTLSGETSHPSTVFVHCTICPLYYLQIIYR